MFELINDLFLDASPIYMYVSIFVTVFSTYQLLHSNTRYWRVDNNVYTLQLHAKEAIILPAQKINLTTEEDKNWIYRKYVRCAHQDDESEPASPRSFKPRQQLRGGFLWDNLYSHL
ncbi:hypothetical protein GLV94_16775 [Virgibacillus halodenitrificans]|uniref:Uncharacterized protein n=1 Tax=Virgibacillus halodenitrificans TaxID=1482 RepID=A0ABR7VIE7_VIRHA|nr:hypothetical protein [Virgibacillus halodenitrificans]MBD1221015.1 hypothetical protein [Virgibacillus halodenitrificans]MCG1030074.1 hypothetical protein [Virgibacillus halodenitrificans]MCJ0929994.1 hypothetical protein [Virgibacillus halodenitrificans]MEC2158272.1 hypothetical protein [Virgibacillus halodenitrificans]MYL47302.1 hypothetical protein [Virgibacillus halodenitrificans]